MKYSPKSVEKWTKFILNNPSIVHYKWEMVHFSQENLSLSPLKMVQKPNKVAIFNLFWLNITTKVETMIEHSLLCSQFSHTLLMQPLSYCLLCCQCLANVAVFPLHPRLLLSLEENPPILLRSKVLWIQNRTFFSLVEWEIGWKITLFQSLRKLSRSQL